MEEGGRAQEPAPPSAEGVDFGGWYENTEGLGERYDFKTAVTKDVTLYARWDRAGSGRIHGRRILCDGGRELPSGMRYRLQG